MYRARQQNNDDDEDPSGEESEDEPEVQTPDDHEDIDDDMDVFGPVSSARKRKSPVKSGGRSPKKGGRVSAAVLRPSAASMRAAAQRAERKAQRLAERQARRQKPRLPLSQQRYIGTAADSMDPFEKARAVLHVGCTPQYLPCRDDEYTEIEAYLEDAIDEGVGSCICELTYNKACKNADQSSRRRRRGAGHRQDCDNSQRRVSTARTRQRWRDQVLSLSRSQRHENCRSCAIVHNPLGIHFGRSPSSQTSSGGAREALQDSESRQRHMVGVVQLGCVPR